MRRVARRFSVVAAGGEMAAACGVVPWADGEAFAAAVRIFDEWLAARGHSGNSEVEAGIAAVRRVIERDGTSRFQPWDEPGKPVGNRLGFVRWSKNADRRTYYIYPESWGEICAPFEPDTIASTMAERGMIDRDSEGRIKHNVRLPGSAKSIRMYVVELERLDQRGGTT